MCCVAGTGPESRDVVCKQSPSSPADDLSRGDNQVPAQDENETRYLVVLPNVPISNRSSSISSVESTANAEHYYLNVLDDDTHLDAKQ